MPDELDIAEEEIENNLNHALYSVQKKVAKMPSGEAGDCNLCGEYFARIVDGNCCRCRDKYKLP